MCFSEVRALPTLRGYFEHFRPGSGFWHICHVDRHGHFTFKQLRLSLVNKTHTKSYTGPRLLPLRSIPFLGDQVTLQTIRDFGKFFSTGFPVTVGTENPGHVNNHLDVVTGPSVYEPFRRTAYSTGYILLSGPIPVTPEPNCE